MTTSTTHTNGRNGGWEYVLRITQVVLIPLMGFLAFQVWANSNTLSQIAGNRFTSKDGLEVWREISAIRQEISGLPKEVPPQWFLNRVDGLESRLSSLQTEVTKLRVTVEANHQ